MVHGDGQISEAELAAFADDSLTPRRRAQTIVTWLRPGRMCVLSGARLSRDELLELAAWNGPMDTARTHNGLLPPLAPAIHRAAA